MRIFGLLLIFVAFVVPVPWFLELAVRYPVGAVLSQYFGVLALVGMGMGQLLITRLPGLESLFGGLDRIYVLHKWLAVFAMVCLLLHDGLDAEIKGLGPETFLMGLAKDMGEVVYYSLLVLVFVTITTFIPYPLWRWSHRFIGVFYGLAVFHFGFIQKPFGNLDPPALYVFGFCAAGVLSYLYMLLVYSRLPGPAAYRVSAVIPFDGAAELVLQPRGKGIRHQAGQFAFFGFDLPGLSEIHPFTLSAAPTADRELRICVKALGHYTGDLIRAAREGTEVRVFGAFGRFLRPRHPGPQIWIAGGIGITPFMAWVRSLNGQSPGPVHLYYLVRSESRAPFLEDLKKYAAAHPEFLLTLHESGASGRLSPAAVLKDHPADLDQTTVCYCGPEGFRKDLQSVFVQAGLRKSRFHYEVFEIRSGIGFLALLSWVVKRFRPSV